MSESDGEKESLCALSLQMPHLGGQVRDASRPPALIRHDTTHLFDTTPAIQQPRDHHPAIWVAPPTETRVGDAAETRVLLGITPKGSAMSLPDVRRVSRRDASGELRSCVNVWRDGTLDHALVHFCFDLMHTHAYIHTLWLRSGSDHSQAESEL